MSAGAETLPTSAARPVGIGPRRRRAARFDALSRGALVLLIIIVLIGTFGHFLPIGDPEEIAVGPRLSPPSWEFLLGTDELGRSFLPRVVHGIRTTFLVSAMAVLATAFIGTIVGMLSAYFGGFVDTLVMRLADVMFAFPAIVLGLLVSALLGPGIFPAVLVISFVTLPLFVRLVRAVTLSVAGREFVVAAEVAGASTARILVLHLLPNVSGAVVVQLTYALSIGMLVESGLSFLGLGTQPPDASLGSLLRLGAVYVGIAPWLVMSSGLLLALSIASVNLTGDGLRDAIDPLRGRALQ
ncbi:MAG TPA: ABC transporter permease [Beijerinckiaceae bacterium]|jgi:peptide/nickel transport system permease protein|nr:ABC transporter permease [Beijerinckiaceae bacterium]